MSQDFSFLLRYRTSSKETTPKKKKKYIYITNETSSLVTKSFGDFHVLVGWWVIRPCLLQYVVTYMLVVVVVVAVISLQHLYVYSTKNTDFSLAAWMTLMYRRC